MDAQSDPCLVLEFNGHHAAVAAQAVAQGQSFRLGKMPSCDFVVDRELTSRIHARIERHHKDFYLIDESTNGTFVQTEDEQVTLVHRDRIKLWGAGWISLGEPLHVGAPIYFRQD
ncbi:MAG: FHA domain-containing protein [bacterium]